MQNDVYHVDQHIFVIILQIFTKQRATSPFPEVTLQAFAPEWTSCRLFGEYVQNNKKNVLISVIHIVLHTEQYSERYLHVKVYYL